MKKLFTSILLLMTVLCLLPCITRTAAAEEDPGEEPEPYYYVCRRDIEAWRGDVYLEFCDDSLSSSMNWDVISGKRIDADMTTRLYAQDTDSRAFLWVTAAGEEAPYYIAYRVNDGKGWVDVTKEAKPYDIPISEGAMKCYRVTLPDVHEYAEAEIEVHWQEDGYNWEKLQPAANQKAVWFTTDVAYEVESNPGISPVKMLEFDTRTKAVFETELDEVSILLYPTEDQVRTFGTYTAMTTLEKLDGNVYRITLPLTEGKFTPCAYLINFFEASTRWDDNFTYVADERVHRELICNGQSYELYYGGRYENFLGEDYSDDTELTIHMTGCSTDWWEDTTIPGIVIEANGEKEYRPIFKEEYDFTFKISDYPNGFTISVDYDVPFGTQYSANYVAYPYYLSSSVNGGEKGYLYPSNDFASYTVGDEVNFFCHDEEGESVSPYKVIITDQSTNETFDVTEDKLSTGEFTYAPKGDKGFRVQVYWSYDEWLYLNYWECCDGKLNKDGRFNELYYSIELIVGNGKIVKEPTDCPNFITSLTYGDRHLYIFSQDERYIQYPSDGQDPMIHFVIVPDDGFDSRWYELDENAEQFFEWDAEKKEFHLDIYNNSNSHDTIQFYSEEDPRPIDPEGLGGKFTLNFDENIYTATARIGSDETEIPVEAYKWTQVPANQDGSYPEVTFRFCLKDGADEESNVIKGFHLWDADGNNGRAVKADDSDGYSFTVNDFTNGLEVYPVCYERFDCTFDCMGYGIEDGRIFVYTDSNPVPSEVFVGTIYPFDEGQNLCFKFTRADGEEPYMVQVYEASTIQNKTYCAADLEDGCLTVDTDPLGFSVSVYWCEEAYVYTNPDEWLLEQGVEEPYTLSADIISLFGPGQLVSVPDDRKAYKGKLTYKEGTKVFYEEPGDECDSLIKYGVIPDEGYEIDYVWVDNTLLYEDSIECEDGVYYIPCVLDGQNHWVLVYFREKRFEVPDGYYQYQISVGEGAYIQDPMWSADGVVYELGADGSLNFGLSEQLDFDAVELPVTIVLDEDTYFAEAVWSVGDYWELISKSFKSSYLKDGVLSFTIDDFQPENSFYNAMMDELRPNSLHIGTSNVAFEAEVQSGSLSGRNSFWEMMFIFYGEDDSDYMVRCSYNEDGTLVQKSVPLHNCYTDYEFSYDVTMEISAKSFTEPVTVELVKGEEVSVVCSGRSYADYLYEILEREDYEEYHEMVKALLNYSAATQEFFAYNTENLANSGLGEEDKVLCDLPVLSDYEFKCTGESELGFSIYGYSLTLTDILTMNVYLECPENFDTDTYVEKMAGFMDWKSEYKDGYLVLHFPYLFISQWNMTVPICVDGLQIECSPFAYLFDIYRRGENAKLLQVCNAIYNLYYAEEQFFN